MDPPYDENPNDDRWVLLTDPLKAPNEHTELLASGLSNKHSTFYRATQSWRSALRRHLPRGTGETGSEGPATDVKDYARGYDSSNVSGSSKRFLSWRRRDRTTMSATDKQRAERSRSEAIGVSTAEASKSVIWWHRNRRSSGDRNNHGQQSVNSMPSNGRPHRIKSVALDRQTPSATRQPCEACRQSWCQIDDDIGAAQFKSGSSWRASQFGQRIDAFGRAKLSANRGAAATAAERRIHSCTILEAASPVKVPLTRTTVSRDSIRRALSLILAPFQTHSPSRSQDCRDCQSSRHKVQSRRLSLSLRARQRPVSEQLGNGHYFHSSSGHAPRLQSKIQLTGRGRDCAVGRDPIARVEVDDADCHNCCCFCCCFCCCCCCSYTYNRDGQKSDSKSVQARQDRQPSQQTPAIIATAPAAGQRQRARALTKFGFQKKPSQLHLKLPDASDAPKCVSTAYASGDPFFSLSPKSSLRAHTHLSNPFLGDSRLPEPQRQPSLRQSRATDLLGARSVSAPLHRTFFWSHNNLCKDSTHASPPLGAHFASAGTSISSSPRDVTSSHHPEFFSIRDPTKSKGNTLTSSFDIYQPHPFGVWHINRDGPTSLPHPPKRSASASFVRQATGHTRPALKHTRNAHSLGTLPDLSSANLSSRFSNGTQRSSLGYAEVSASGFPFILPESGSETTNTPGSELASEVGSLRRFNAASDAGSATMSRSYSDQPSMRSYEESSVSAKGPGATINRKIGENLSSTLREHFPPSPATVPSPSPRHDDGLSVVEHRGAPSLFSNHEAFPSASIQHAETGPNVEAAADPAELRPLSHSNASAESTSSPIMKMQPPSITTPSLRDFPINADHNPSFESVHAPIRQRTDSRPTISPTNTSRAISTPAPMPLPQALQDLRPTVRRAQGQRAESEVVRSRNSSKPFIFPSRSSAQFAPQERDSVLQTKFNQAKNGGSFIRRLIRRASLKGNKSQSVGGTPSLVLSPGKTSIALPSELEIQDSSAVTTPRAESFSSRGTKESKPRNSLTRRRSKSKDTGSTKTSKTSSIFAPFLARDPNKSSGKFRTRRADSFGHLGPLPLDDAPPFPRDGLPLSSSSPFLARDPDFAGFRGEEEDGVRSRDFAGVRGTKHTSRSSPDQQEAAELLESPEMKQAEEVDPENGEKPRPLSHVTDQTDHSLGMGMPLSSGSNFNFQDSLSLNELSAAATQRSDATNPEIGSYGRHQRPVSSNGHSGVTEGHARPRAGIPRIWQGLEPIDGDNTMRSTHIDDADSSDDTPPDHSVPANRFDTATTTSSFKTAMSNLDSPKSASTRRHNIGSRASRGSLRTLDTPLARHFDQGTRQDSPLADLITNLERRISFHSNSGTMGSAPYQDATASPSSECLHLEADDARPAIAAGPSPSPSLNGGQLYHDDYHDEDDDASIRALPRETHLPSASHTALVETMGHSNRNSLVEPTPLSSQEVVDSRGSEHHWYKRDTFGGLDSLPLAAVGSPQSGPIADAARPQISRFSTATAGPEDEDHPMDHVEGDDTEEQEIVLPEVKVSEIESHLAAVEAALQDNRDEGSFDPTSLRQRMSDASYVLHANTSSASMLSRDGSLQPMQQPVDKSTDDLSLPGAWTQDSSSFIMSDDGRRITLAPESHEALADAVRSVRKAISSSQLTDADESRTAIASRSVDTLGMESFVSDVAEPASERMPAGEMSMMSEATPARAARRRQEGMRDIEEAYSRMLALVQSSAIGVTPSPQMRADEGRLGLKPPRRPMKHGQALSGGNEPFFNSPLAKSSTKTDEPLSQPVQPKRNTFDGANISQSGRPQARAQSIGETRTSTSLSGLMGMPLDINPQMLRHASVSSVSSAQDISRNESVEGAPVRRRPPSDAKSSSSRFSQALSRDHIPSSLIDSDGFRKRFSTDNTTVGRASSGGGHTSPSATAKTLGTPRSFATSVSQHSLANMVRRHELEKESLLDTLERVRAENADLHARHDSLTSDLHAEVTRVLELERELERRDSREVTLIVQIQDLENELMELRYLDHKLNFTADQTLGSEDGEGSIMDVELPPSFHTTSRMGSSAFSPRVKADQVVSPPPSFSSASVSALAKPTHRSTRSEAFVSDLPGSERSTLPTSGSELPRARPVSLLNGPGGLFREDGGSVRSSQASPLPTPRSSSLLRVHRGSSKATRAQQASPVWLGLSLPKEEDEMWNIADEQLPEIEDELVPVTSSRSHQQVPSMSTKGETFDSTLVNSGHHDDSYEDEEDRNSSVPSTIQQKNLSTVSNNGGTPLRDSSSSCIPRSTSQATVTSTQLARPSPVPSKIPTSRSLSGISDSPSHRSISSRLPRLGLKPSTRYSTGGGGIRSVSGATDKSAGSTLSSVYSNMSAGAPPSLGSLPSGNNTMEDEIQAELARLGHPQPYMRYYSPPRSKMI